MKSSPLGAVLANALSLVARGLGVVIYYGLRAIYRPRDRMIALGGLTAFIAAVALLIWML